MIILENLTHASVDTTKRAVLDNLTIRLPTDRRLGILGRENAGKTALMRLLAGFDKPRDGVIHRHARLSLPIGYDGVFKRQWSPRKNIERFADFYGDQIDEIFFCIAAITDMEGSFDVPLANLPQELQLRFIFAAGYAMPFDCYLIDERFAPPEKEFRRKCIAMLEDRCASNGVIIASRRANVVQRFCDIAAVLADGQLTLYDDVTSAVEAYEELGVEVSDSLAQTSDR